MPSIVSQGIAYLVARCKAISEGVLGSESSPLEVMAEEWDEQGLGSLFVDGGTPEPEYAIQCLTVDRQQLSHEGATTVGFTPLVDRFDHPEKSAGRERATLLRLEPLRVYFREKRHSLWGHKLWNAARYLVKRIDSHMIDVRGKRVLELGAGLGVPSLAAFRNGARCVVVTDYNDKELLDIIQMNVNANCKPEMVDDDAVAFLLERMEHLRAMQMIPKQAVEKGKDGAINTQCIVQPLLWGNAEHIREALQRTGGAGFDVLLLSDILFNHVCNDDLADTVAQLLQRSQHAAAYCAFSHHRAHKQVEDLQFFDKCNSRGLACEQIDEEDYPLMFPDDNGPVEIRQPVKVYKITHRFDEAGPPLEIGQDQYDVAIQGAGVVECIVAAALARSGFRVLQCDAQSEYGGPFKTLSVERLRVYLEAQSAGEHSEGGSSATIVMDHMYTLDDRRRNRFMLDLLPTQFLAGGETIQQLVASDMARHVDFQRCGCFAFLVPCSNEKLVDGVFADGVHFQLQSVPLTRSQVFADGNVSPLQKCRIMKFVKDIAAPLAESLHAREAPLGDDPLCAISASSLNSREGSSIPARQPNESLSELLRRVYAVNDEAIDIITFMRQLETLPGRDVELVRHVLTSIGRYGGKTPFLIPMYGAAEVPQNMCRIAAVWNSLSVLRRSVRRVLRDVGMPAVEMSNGQRVKTRTVIVPRVLSNQPAFGSKSAVDNKSIVTNSSVENGNVACFSRVIIVAATPLVTWDILRTSVFLDDEVVGLGEEEEDACGANAPPPLFIGLCRPRPGVVVHLQQQSAASDQAPNDGSSVVLHFTADGSLMSVQELRHFVESSFLTSDEVKATKEGNEGICLDRKAILFFATFSLREDEEALRGLVPVSEENDLSETRKAHPFAMTEFRLREEKLQRQRERNTGVKSNSGHGIAEVSEDFSGVGGDDNCAIVYVRTLFQNVFDDGAYMHESQKAYEAVVKELQKGKECGGGGGQCHTFLERLPPLS